MGIYIKGMDFLPEDGTEFVVKKDEYGTWIKPIGHMGFSMRLIDVPEPHGRLIDIKSVEYGKFTTVGNEYQRWWNGALESVIDNAPTVIEAEGSET